MSRLVGLCLLSSVSHHRLWVMMDGNSVLTNMMHHRWTWVEMLFSYNRRHTLAPKHWLLRGRQLLGSSAVILLLRELHIRGSLNFCPMAHMMSPALQMLHSSLLGSCSGGQTRTVACKQSRLTLLRFKNGAAVSCQGFRCLWCVSLLSIWSCVSMFLNLLPSLCPLHRPQLLPAWATTSQTQHWWERAPVMVTGLLLVLTRLSPARADCGVLLIMAGWLCCGTSWVCPSAPPHPC